MKAKATLFLLVLTLICLTSCAVSLKNYKPANPEEASIISTLMGFEKSYNSGDQKAVLDLFADDARITTGDPRNKKVVTKEEYGRILPERFKAVGNLWISDPKIRIEGNIATVKTTVGSKFGEVPNYIFKLKKHGDKWLILATEY